MNPFIWIYVPLLIAVYVIIANKRALGLFKRKCVILDRTTYTLQTYIFSQLCFFALLLFLFIISAGFIAFVANYLVVLNIITGLITYIVAHHLYSRYHNKVQTESQLTNKTLKTPSKLKTYSGACACIFVNIILFSTMNGIDAVNEFTISLAGTTNSVWVAEQFSSENRDEIIKSIAINNNDRTLCGKIFASRQKEICTAVIKRQNISSEPKLIHTTPVPEPEKPIRVIIVNTGSDDAQPRELITESKINLFWSVSKKFIDEYDAQDVLVSLRLLNTTTDEKVADIGDGFNLLVDEFTYDISSLISNDLINARDVYVIRASVTPTNDQTPTPGYNADNTRDSARFYFDPNLFTQ